MRNLAVKYEEEYLFQELGTVIAGEGNNLLVRSDTGTHRMRRAVSCLIEPETGDQVLFCLTADNGYVLAVLERQEKHAATISVAGGMNLHLDTGAFQVTAPEGIALASPKTISMLSSELEVTAGNAAVTIQKMTFTGSVLKASLDRIKLFADSLDSVLDRLHQRLKRSYRFVEETDQVRANTIDQRAENLLNMNARNAVIQAHELVKIDGEQIHVG